MGRLVIVRRGSADDEQLMRHELVHVRQWRELGVVRFLGQYLGAYFRGRWNGQSHWDAYRRIPLEVEAEQEAEWGTSAHAAEAGSSTAADPAVTDVLPLRSESLATVDPAVTDVPPLESEPPAG